MSFIRRTLVISFAMAVLVIAGVGGRNAVQAANWYDLSPVPSVLPGPTPTSGEPDVAGHRVRRTPVLDSSFRKQAAPDRGAFTRQILQVRWTSWIWAGRYLGMGI